MTLEEMKTLSDAYKLEQRSRRKEQKQLVQEKVRSSVCHCHCHCHCRLRIPRTETWGVCVWVWVWVLACASLPACQSVLVCELGFWFL
jgi:hypothetical protein